MARRPLVRPVVALAAAHLRRRGPVHLAPEHARSGAIGRIADRPRPDHPRAAADRRGDASRSPSRRRCEVIFVALAGDLLLDMLVGARAHGAVVFEPRVVLLIATLAGAGVIPLPVALGLVLGANLGSGLLAMLATAAPSPQARRVPLGNLSSSSSAACSSIAVLPQVARLLQQLDPDVAAAGGRLPPRLQPGAGAALHRLHRAGRPHRRALAARPDAERRRRRAPRHLDPAALDTPALAISQRGARGAAHRRHHRDDAARHAAR